jgi:hypothetical protein
MVIYTFEFSLALRFIVLALAAFYSYKIAKMRLTPTLTFMLIAAYCLISLGLLVDNVFEFGSLLNFYRSIGSWHAVIRQIVMALSSSMLFIAIIRTYSNLKIKYDGSLDE